MARALFWIETGFKALKSVGWQRRKTRRTDPARVGAALAGFGGGDAADARRGQPGGGRSGAEKESERAAVAAESRA